MIIKVCGMRDADNIRAVADLGVDLIGFVFCPQSLRFVKMIPSRAGIIPDYSEQRLKEVAVRGSVGNNAEAGGYGAGLLGRPKRVGVFVNDMPQNIVTRAYNYKLDYIQLHGNEPRETCENLRKRLNRTSSRILKSSRPSVWAKRLIFSVQTVCRGGRPSAF